MMFIMAAAGTQFIESEFCKRFMLLEKNDAVLIVGIYDDTNKPITLGRYADMDEAKETLLGLFYAQAGGQSYYTMPDSRLSHEQEKKHDARTKRKGGS